MATVPAKHRKRKNNKGCRGQGFVKATPLYKIFVLLPNFFFFGKDFLWTMDRDKNGHDGLNGQEWTAEWTMDNGRWTMDDGRWTMDRDYVAPFRANPNIADQSKKPIDQITNPRATSSVGAATPIKNFRTTITQNLVFCERFSKTRCASCWP
jgi:hypothetical protein